jgi:TOMM system kinase/cyclase fusion protein
MTGADIELAPGFVFAQSYEVLADLGTGSFGRVYKAQRLSTRQLVAIKVLRAGPGGESGAALNRRERFRREMRVCSELSHPNIVRLIDSGEEPEGNLFAVFEFVPGVTLRRIIEQEGKLSVSEAVHLMSQVLDAIACAHARGVVHRDLKPENLMVTQTGIRRNALVLDFGLGGFSQEGSDWSLPRLTATQEMLGTPSYAAPEQLRGEPATPRSDVYSWGLILLECLTGECAVSGATVQQILHRQLGPEAVPIPDHLRGGTLGKLLAAATVKAVDRRTVTVEECFEALRRLDVGPEEPRSPERRQDLQEGERRQLTVVACRLVVESGVGSELDPEVIDEILRTQHAALVDLASRRGGQLAGVLADRVLLAFGHPQAREDDARRAARVALRIAAEITGASRALESERGVAVTVHVGVHTGLVVARELPQATRDELHPLVGSTPRIALLLAEEAPPGQVLASEDTRRLLRGEMASERAGALHYDRASAPLAFFRLDERQGVGAGSSFSAENETPLVGRDTDLRRLVDGWKGVRSDQSGVVLIMGEPGIGKSRLVRELRRQVEARDWWEGHCAPEDQANQLRPVVDLLSGLDNGVDRFLAHCGLEREESVPLFADLLPLPQDHYTALNITPERRRELTLNALVTGLLALASARPTALVLEDLHWADQTTLDLVALLVQELRASALETLDERPKLYFVLTARPEFTPGWPLDDTNVIVPGRLEHRDVEAMVQGRLGPHELSTRTLIEKIVEHADGIPLFVEELTRALLERSNDGDFRDTGTENVEVPSTLRDLLTARLDTLSSLARETAQIGAALGREFRRDQLAVISTRADRLDADFAELIASGLLLRRRRARGEVYLFRHALVRDAAHDSMTRATRRTVHARAASALRRHFPELERDRPDVLAQHFEEAGETSQAADLWKRAGDRTMAGGGYVDSMRHFQRGLKLIDSSRDPSRFAREEMDLTESLGVAMTSTEGYSSVGAEHAFKRALDACDRFGVDPSIRILHGVCGLYLSRGDAEGTDRHLPRVYRLAERTPNDLNLLSAHAYRGLRALHAGDLQLAAEQLRIATKHYDTPGYHEFLRSYGYDGGLYAFGYLMWSLTFLGRFTEARQVRDEMLARVEETGNPYGRAMALGFAAHFARECGDVDATLDYSSRAIAHINEQKVYAWLAQPTCTYGWALAKRGRVGEGIAHLEQGIGLMEMIGFRQTQPYHIGMLVEVLTAHGAVGAAITAADKALRLCRTTLDCFYEPELLRMYGEALSEGSEDRRAYLQESFGAARRQAAILFGIRSATRIVESRLAPEEKTEMQAALSEMLNRLKNEPSVGGLAEARTLLRIR